MGTCGTAVWHIACSLLALLYWSGIALAVGLVAGQDPLLLLSAGASATAMLAAAGLLTAAVLGYAIAARSAYRRTHAR